MPYINNGGLENGPFMEELMQRTDSMNGEKQKDSETRETDVVDGTPAPVEINPHRRGSVEKKSIQGTIQASGRTDRLFDYFFNISVLFSLFIELKVSVFYLMVYFITVLLNMMSNFKIKEHFQLSSKFKQDKKKQISNLKSFLSFFIVIILHHFEFDITQLV